MILKIGRCPEVSCGSTEDPHHNPVWEYVEKAQNVVVKKYETPSLLHSGTDTVMDIMYITGTDEWLGDLGLIHSTTLSGADLCYLMNDEGRTIERLR